MSLAFFVTAFVVVATPGTGALLSIAAGLRSGPRRSLVTAFGCTLGIIPHLMAAITGAAVLLRAGGLAFEIVKVLGVAYLLYMAWSTWRDTGVLTVQADIKPSSPTKTIVSAVLANLLNPKLTIFFFVPAPVRLRPGHPSGLADGGAERGVHGDDVRRVRLLRHLRRRSPIASDRAAGRRPTP